MSALLAKLEHEKLMQMDWVKLQALGKELGCPPLYISNKIFKERLQKHIEVKLAEETTKNSKGGGDLWSAKNEAKTEYSPKTKPPVRSEEKQYGYSNKATRSAKPPPATSKGKPKSKVGKSKKNFPPPRPASSKGKNAEKKKPNNGIIKSSLKRVSQPVANNSKFCAPVFCVGTPTAVDEEKNTTPGSKNRPKPPAVAYKSSNKGGTQKAKEKTPPPDNENRLPVLNLAVDSNTIQDRRRNRTISRKAPIYNARQIHPLKMQIEKPNIKHFDLLKEIGAGAFGKVYQVKHLKTGNIYAMKVLKKKKIVERNQVEHTKTERLVLNLSRHPFCVTLRCAFQTPKKLYFVMDFYRGGELFFHLQKVQRFKEETVRLMVAEVTLALGHLHTHDIIYRDLKPENILIDQNGHLALTDFGMTKRLKKGEATKTFCGTPEYLAPEVIKGLAYDKNVDWWSVGILCYELSVGIPPYYSAQSLNEMYRKIQFAKLSWRRRDKYLSKELMDFVAQLLVRNPAERLGTGSEDADEVVSHDFFSVLDLDEVMAKKVVPLYKPRFKGGSKNIKDTSNFEDVKRVKETVYKHDDRKQQSSVNHFENFTLVPEAYLGGHM